MKIGIVGAGLMGAKLGTLWARAGHDVVFSYARDLKKLAKLGTPATVTEAAQRDVVLLAVNWDRIDDVLAQAGPLAGKTVITTCLAMKDGAPLFGADWSATEELTKRLPRARVVAAFGTIPSECLFGVYAGRKKAARPSLLHYGAKVPAAVRLIKDLGFDPIDAGDASVGRTAEAFTLLVAHLAYERPGGAGLTYTFARHRELKR
ncbi:MAG: NAD(P)-binding domain-containing protein [Kofleriaceae bacterium]